MLPAACCCPSAPWARYATAELPLGCDSLLLDSRCLSNRAVAVLTVAVVSEIGGVAEASEKPRTHLPSVGEEQRSASPLLLTLFVLLGVLGLGAPPGATENAASAAGIAANGRPAMVRGRVP
jgi:hypothetical protein